MRLANGIVAFHFDPRTGSLIRIEDLRTGVEHLASPADGRLFRVVVPDPDDWLDRHCESHESGQPGMRMDAGRLTINYPNLKVAGGGLSGISAVVTVTLPEGADEARFVIEINNGSPFVIEEVLFPWIAGWTGYAGPGEDRVTLGDCTFVDPHRLRLDPERVLSTFMAAHRRRFFAFPAIFGMFPVLDISGGGRGLSYIHYPTEIIKGGIALEDLNDERPGDTRVAWTWTHVPFIEAGASWKSDPVGIAPHSGDWHATADRLRAWLGTWWRPPVVPARLADSVGYQNVVFRNHMGERLRPFSDLPALARHGLEHGLEHFVVWDMVLMGMYLRAGRGTMFEDPDGRLPELVEALKETRAMGVQTSTLINIRLITQNAELWNEWGRKHVMRTMYGVPVRESYPLRVKHGEYINMHLDPGGASLCQSDAELQDWALSMLSRGLDLGFDSLFVDEPFEKELCFNGAHGHPVPMHGHIGACEVLEKTGRMVRERSPDGYVIGESPDIWNSRFIDVGFRWTWGHRQPEVFRYIMPDSLQSWPVDAYEHGRQVAKAVSMGMQLAIYVGGLEKVLPDVPEFAERVRRLAGLRRRTQDFTVRGRFLDRKGLRVDTDANIEAHVYDAGEKLGVILGETATTREGGGKLKLSLDAAALERPAPREVRLHREDGSTEEVSPAVRDGELELETRLDRWETAVVEFS